MKKTNQKRPPKKRSKAQRRPLPKAAAARPYPKHTPKRTIAKKRRIKGMGKKHAIKKLTRRLGQFEIVLNGQPTTVTVWTSGKAVAGGRTIQLSEATMQGILALAAIRGA